MKGTYKSKQALCQQCGARKRFEKNSMIWGCGDLIMIILTFGIWMVLRFAGDFLLNPWRCKDCGGKT
jgi:hypothetical protein